ncbi:HD domain-containing protein [Persicimonas caeni]|uniref:HD domain-containing protein n=1 Tax=Persicimonas caeni TaxID=2292766 RepID=A0A4Y6PT99_PERCE|nr:HD domain-containing protein [Persicimonas caeni]QDG51528.1 HD domain-containing protein [Persicimonas caeni]QED32749.1 HD domain-containing protein [Persicimonas caeni]
MNKKTFRDAIAPLIDRPWVAPTVDFLADELGDSGSHDFGHILRVLRNAARIRDGEAERGATVDWEALSAAAILHDVVDLPKDHPERHLASTKSADAAVEHYKSLEALAGRLDAVHHAIRAHSFSAGVPAESLEAQILCDADRLEAIGAFGIARVFYVNGELQRKICDMADPFADTRELDDLEYAVDHFYKKLLKLKERFYTPTGRQLAAKRHEFMETYLDQLADEVT